MTTPTQEAPKRIWINNPTEITEHNQTWWYENPMAFPTVEYVRADLSPVVDVDAKWDKSGLKEACQRALKLDRTHQEMDIQLVLDMLLEIERLGSALTAAVDKQREVEPVCWHCGVVLAYAPKFRCEDCPTDCDVENCDAYGCAEKEIGTHD